MIGSDSPSPSRPRWRRLLISKHAATRLAFAVGALGFTGWLLVRHERVPFEQMDVALFPLVAAGLIQAIYIAVQGDRQRRTLQIVAKAEIPCLWWQRTFAIGRLANLAIAQGGNVFQAGKLRSTLGLKLPRYVLGQAGFAWLSLEVTLAIAAAIALIARDTSSNSAAIGLITTAGVGLIAPWALKQMLRQLPTRLQRARYVQRLLAVSGDFSAGVISAPFLRQFVALSSISFALGTSVTYLVFISLGASPALAAIALYYALQQISATFIITPGNLGVQELVLLFVSDAWLTIAPEVAVSASLLTRAIVFCASLLNGALLLRSQGTSADTA